MMENKVCYSRRKVSDPLLESLGIRRIEPSDAVLLEYNDNHDPSNGQFASGGGSGGGGGGSRHGDSRPKTTNAKTGVPIVSLKSHDIYGKAPDSADISNHGIPASYKREGGTPDVGVVVKDENGQHWAQNGSRVFRVSDVKPLNATMTKYGWQTPRTNA